MPSHAANLVPGRSCGDCTLCCRVPPVDTPQFQKQAGVLCSFCEESRGCSIHATRPAVCREWFCGWRRLPRLGEDWRPDRCGVLIALGADEVPIGLGPYQSTKFIVTDDGGWLSQPAFLSYLAGLVHARAAVYLAAPGPPAHHAVKTLLNDALAGAVARSDGSAMAAILQRLFANLAAGPFERVELQYGPQP